MNDPGPVTGIAVNVLSPPPVGPGKAQAPGTLPQALEQGFFDPDGTAGKVAGGQGIVQADNFAGLLDAGAE
ncbi:MAG: hypothetical protein JRI76_08535 [Deltaproteobacteria bacterium]|nr:hypothetical protein [Deltaproteobacteria bacterium]MBW1954170.1 hypothetical protein [Deltaproteobacteria bacterium]MBW2042066.1 hypothetical protein [Deltaproteobacteria bacterium]MBW2132783.1 hypothetical protein [Deltaproteobacteria bacterium]